MKITFIYIFLISILLSCNQNATKDSEQVNQVAPIDSVSAVVKDTVDNTKFPAADSLLYSFFSNLNELEKFIDAEQGVYCLAPGPGATPVFEKLKTKEDVLGKDPFLFMYRDYAFIKNTVKVNPTNFIFCDNQEEGYFIFDCDKQQRLLQDVYQITQTQGDKTVDSKVLVTLKQIDENLYRSVVVSFKEKHGDLITIKLYFTKKNNRIYLSIIDIRDCAA
ncbi:MAG: hypothetical protein IPG89_04690 [Bacteroidetes bacterium]|nr:hypothetical protein [Bacteroidota bacterium]